MLVVASIHSWMSLLLPVNAELFSLCNEAALQIPGSGLLNFWHLLKISLLEQACIRTRPVHFHIQIHLANFYKFFWKKLLVTSTNFQFCTQNTNAFCQTVLQNSQHSIPLLYLKCAKIYSLSAKKQSSRSAICNPWLAGQFSPVKVF